MANPISVVLADESPVFAEGLLVMLAAQDDLEVLGLAHNADMAVDLAAKHEPTVLLLDLNLLLDIGARDITSILKRLKAASPASKVLVLSADTGAKTIARVIQAGADGLLVKAASSQQMADAIRTIAKDDTGTVIVTEHITRPTAVRQLRGRRSL